MAKNGRQGEGGGPKTPEGKARSAMNAVKTGQHVKRYDLIGKNAGKLPMCSMCGEEQKAACGQAAKCLKLDEKIAGYFLSHEKRDPKYHEKYTIPQIAMMDMLFDWLLQDTADNLNEMIPIYDKEGNPVGERPKINDQRFYTLQNMMAALGKTPKDLALTRATMESLDLQIAEMLASAQPEKAEEFRNKILDSVKKWHEGKSRADNRRALDQAIEAHVSHTEKAENIVDFTAENIPDSPFDNGE